MKKLVAFGLAAGLGIALAAGPANADSHKGNGNAYGKVGCELADGSDYETPGKMLQALADRDGSFQATVEKFGFGSVANLISEKCGN